MSAMQTVSVLSDPFFGPRFSDSADFGIAAYFESGKLTLIEVMPGATLEQVRAGTSAKFVERLAG